MDEKNFSKEEKQQEQKEQPSVDINQHRLFDVQSARLRTRRLSTTSIFSLVLSFVTLAAVYLYFSLTYISPVNTALRVNDIKVDNQTYDQVKAYLSKGNQGDGDIDNMVSMYLVDTIILSEKAKELGLKVDEKEIEPFAEHYGKMAERVALRTKLEEFLKEEAKNITEEEMRDFYEKMKDDYYAVADSEFQFYAVQSDMPIPDNYKLDTTRLTLQTATLEELRAYGIHLPEKGVHQIESPENDIYQYIIIVDGEVVYLPYEQVKESIRNTLYIQKTDGQIQEYLQEGRIVADIDYFR